MDKLNKDDIEVVDKIIKYLYGLNFPECLSEYNILKLHIIEMNEEVVKNRIDKILISENICLFNIANSNTYKLSENGIKIVINYGTFRNYKNKIKNDKIIEWVKWIVLAIIPIVIYFAERPSNNTQNSSNPLKKEVYDVNQKHKRSETIKEVKTHEMIDSANHVSTHKQIPNKHK
jgi:hypothetical protein